MNPLPCSWYDQPSIGSAVRHRGFLLGFTKGRAVVVSEKGGTIQQVDTSQVSVPQSSLEP